MKTKIRKSLATILALVMVLSMVSFASAQVFPDIPESLDSAATRLAGLGIIAGYPDGTFRPDNNITRGEFAKIAVIVLGLEKSADLLENVPSNFKDVKVGDWYNKYVNVAANQGILKGYPDGTFKPNSNITQAEALTIVLRLLGYKEDHLPGNWPYNYVTQADRIGLLDAGFDTGVAAIRGWVADLVSRALDTATVTWADDEGFKEGKTLVAKSFGGQVIEAVRVASALAASTGDTITVVDADGKETTLNVAANAVINGAAFADLRNHMVDLTTKLVSGKEVVVAIDVLSAKLTGEVTKVNNLSRVVTINGTEVTFGEAVQLPQPQDTLTVYVYKGRVYYAEAAEAANAGVITDISLGATNTITIDYLTTKTIAAGAAITVNGAKATLADLAANQYVVYELNAAGEIKLDAYSNVVIGTLESWEMENSQVTSITVNGVKYSAVKDLDMEGVEIGVIVMLSLNNHNQVYRVLPFGSYASTVIGEFDSLSSRASTEGRVYYIVLKNGTSYDITEAVVAAEKGEEVLFVDLESTMVFTELNVENSMVKICYNVKGEVVAVYVFSSQTIIEKPDEGWNLVGGVPEVLFGKFAQGSTTYSKDGMPTATLVVEGPVVTEVLRYVITWDAESGIAKHIDAITVMNKGTVTGIGSDSRGKYVLINVTNVTKGKAVSGKYYFSEETESFYATLNIYDEIEFTFKDAEDMWTGFGQGTIKKLNYLKVTKYAEPGTPPPSSGGPEEPTGTVTYINDTRIFIDGERYAMDEDTVLYDKDGKTVKHVGGAASLKPYQ